MDFEVCSRSHGQSRRSLATVCTSSRKAVAAFEGTRSIGASVLTAEYEPVKSTMPKPVRLYTTGYCPYCRLAERLLRERGIPFEEIDVGDDVATRRWLVEATGRRTVPQIFIGEQAIGGYEELRALDRSGELAALVGS